MEKTYKYDAFISYRHVSPDKPIAERLQKLLETYVPPKGVRENGDKRKLHLFRDETELPTSNDLGGDIRRALEDSRFLVVICSPEYEKSKWCMEEVRYFKELHGGANRNILTILADDPDVRPAFPEALRFETVTETLENGETVTSEREIEPLAANVCAKTQAQMLKKLKSEFLRIAAPLLGCGYDDLYHREQRSATQRKLRFAFGTAAVLAVGVLLSTAALLTIRAKNRQIAADALELRRNNAELLLKESEMLEKDGDLFGALQAAADAFPEDGDGFEPACGTLSQLVDLTGAYEPRSFAPIKKLHFSSVPQSMCMFEDGRRLVVVTAAGAELIDTETGETLKTLPGVSKNNAFFYRDPSVNAASVSRYTGSTTIQHNNNGSVFYERNSKDLQQETQAVGSAFYVTYDDRDTVERISPDTGEAIWSARVEDMYSIKTAFASRQALFVQTVFGFTVLDAASGETIASVNNEQLRELPDLNKPQISYGYYENDYLVVTTWGANEDVIWVFRRNGGGFEFLFSETIGVHSLGGLSYAFLIRDDTLYVTGAAHNDMLADNMYFRAFDLVSQECKWTHQDLSNGEGTPFVGYIETDKGSGNAFGVAYAVMGRSVIVVNAETGEEIGRHTMPGVALDLYCSENGILFINQSSGIEMYLSLRNFTGEDDGFLLNSNRFFGTEIVNAAYCNNLYAVCRENETDVILYRPLPNEACETLYRMEDEKKSLYDVCVSPDGSAAAFETHDPDQIVVIDPTTKQMLFKLPFDDIFNSMAFPDNAHLALHFYESIQIYSVPEGKLLLELKDDDYELNSAALSPAGELWIQEKDGAVQRVRPGESPRQEEALAHCEGFSEVPEENLSLVHMGLSPAGNRLLLFMSGSVSEKDSFVSNDASRIFLYDITNQTVTACGGLFDYRYYDVSGYAFTEDESALYLLHDNVILGFSTASGEQICSAKFNGSAVTVFTIGNDLCLLTTEGDIVKVRVRGSECETLQRMALSIESPLGSLFSCTVLKNGRAVLRHSHASWIIDVSAFEPVCTVEMFCGINEERGLIYQEYYSTLNVYPLRSDADLLALAKARLGE